MLRSDQRFGRFMTRIRPSASAFRRHDGGATAVEMGFVAGPFLFGLLALFEVALTFLGGQTLQVAVDNVARQIRTGEVRTSTAATRTGFIDAVCAEAFLLYDCSNQLRVDIRTFPTFASITSEPPVDEDGDWKDADMEYDIGAASSIVVARAFYKRNPIAPMFTSSPARLDDGSLLLTSALVFQNEPYD